MSCAGEHVAIDDTRLWVVERGSGTPVIVLHGGPGLDHHEFAHHLDRLTDDFRLILVDQRSQGLSDPAPPTAWTLERMAQDVIMLARAMGLKRYAVLGHSYGAFVALQNAVDYPGMAAATIVSSGIPSARFLLDVDRHLDTFEPADVRERVIASWAREESVQTADEFHQLLIDQMPFAFADPLDPRIGPYVEESRGVYSPAVLRYFASATYGGIELEDRLGEVQSPVLVLAGRHDRICSPEAAEAIAAGVPRAELHILEGSGHMTFVEEPDLYLASVRTFLEGTL